MSSTSRFLTHLGRLAFGLLLLTPLVVDFAAHDDAYMGPKWAWVAICSALAGVGLLSRFVSGRPVMFPFDEVWIAALLFAAWHWIAVAWARSPGLATDRAARVSWALLALWAGIHALRTRRALLRLAWGFLFICTLTALWVLFEDCLRAFFPNLVYLHPNLSDWRGYLAAGLGNTSHIGDLLALGLFPVLVMFGETRCGGMALLLGALAVLFAAGLIVSYSVGSNLGLVIGAALMVGMVLWRCGVRWFTRRWPRWLALVLAWGVLVAFLNLNIPGNPHRPGILKEGFGSERWAEGGPTREVIWAQALEMIRQHPWLGVGSGNFTYVFPEMDSRLLAGRPDLLIYQGIWTNAAHNEILQTWSELGIGGLFLLVALCGLGFYHLFRRLGEADPLGFRLRVALAGLLTAFCLHSQMNFTLQHPVGLLTFFGLLLAIIAEKRTRPRVGGAMPSLRWESGPFALQVDWHSMQKPTGIGAALLLPQVVSIVLIAAMLGGRGLLVKHELRPVRAQREYQRGYLAEHHGDPAGAEAHFKRALEVYPDATDCRSHYSGWLVERHRPQEALAQIAIVRQRLNSNELWLRESVAYDELGEHAKAQAALATARQRVWNLRQQAN